MRNFYGCITCDTLQTSLVTWFYNNFSISPEVEILPAMVPPVLGNFWKLSEMFTTFHQDSQNSESFTKAIENIFKISKTFYIQFREFERKNPKIPCKYSKCSSNILKNIHNALWYFFTKNFQA